ncbi:MAG TPA: response regulator transcription factor [Methylovirgula sp.]
MRILLVEDDPETADYVSQGLSDAGHQVALAVDGQSGLHDASAGAWDLLIVDRLLPKIDGLTLVRTLRDGGNECPIIFLTTLGGIDDRVCGLEGGGDDYLVKPFAFLELAARVNALGRRPRQLQKETELKVGDLEIDLINRAVRQAGRSLDLMPQEFRLLEYLTRHAGQVVTRAMLLENVWDLHFDPGTNIVENHISRLRSKLDKGNSAQLISTVRGCGYKFHVSG